MKLTDLRGILRYIPQFRDKTFIINVDGAIVTDENFTNLLVDIAVLRSLNIHVVLVHGASAQIRALARETGRAPSNLDGTGITDEATLQLGAAAALQFRQRLFHALGDAPHARQLGGAVRRQPWEFNGEIALRQVLTLSVSFDHRLVDGEQGSKFLADVGAILAKPAMLLAMI